ncbi:MAG: hypothetical protein RIM80_02380, partial [Alphaproteobacteria bacterium]
GALDLDAIAPDFVSEYRNHKGNQAFVRGQVEACADYHSRAAAVAEGPLWRARALGGLGDAYYAAGRMRSAARSFGDCVDLAREHGLGIVEMANAFMTPMCRFFAEGATVGLAMIDVAIDRLRQVGNARSEFLALAVRLQLRVFALRLDAAAEDAAALEAASDVLGGTRFDLENAYLVAELALARGDIQAAQERAEALLRRASPEDLGYFGPPIFALAARIAKDATTVAARLDEGEALLASGCVSHCHFWFRLHAIDAALAHGLWDAAEAQADALLDYTAAEPLAWSDIVAERGRLLARIGRDGPSAETAAAAAALADRAELVDLLQLSQALRHAAPSAADVFDAALTLPPTAP